MEMGDLEAAFVGNLARYCMAMGTIPRRPLKGFWWVNGVCRGVNGGFDEDEFDLFGNPNGFDYLHEVREVVQHLRTWAPAVVKTEGVEELLSAGDDVRWYSLKMFPQEDMDWINEDEACELSGRSTRTLRLWRDNGWVSHIKDNWGVLYSKGAIEVTVAAMDSAKRNATRNAISARRDVAANPW